MDDDDPEKRIGELERRLAEAQGMVPPPPGMVEAVTGCPQSLVRCLARMRAFRSVTPPGGNGTMSLTSLLG